MKFRKLYWVTEQVGTDGNSKVIGTYTSIHDLRTKGIRWDEECDLKSSFRVSLVKLDSSKISMGCWQGPSFSGLEEELQPFVETGEFDEPSIIQLATDLRKL
ncbi:MAG: hypothetical protein ACKVQS_00195 [Fimbriimonadaceae bacterium]